MNDRSSQSWQAQPDDALRSVVPAERLKAAEQFDAYNEAMQEMFEACAKHVLDPTQQT
jgi:hypothetical protein